MVYEWQKICRPLKNQAFVGVLQARALSKRLDSVEAHPTDYVEARKWAAELRKDSIPRNISRVRYDRSSGKGGQHVNT